MQPRLPPFSTIAPLLERFAHQAEASKSLIVSPYRGEYRGLRMQASFGMGTRARVPWLAFFGRQAPRPSLAWYPVVLYYTAAKVLVVAYGIGEECPRQTAWPHVNAKSIQEELPLRFNHVPERYGSSLLEHAFVLTDAANFKEAGAALDRVVDCYLRLVQQRQMT